MNPKRKYGDTESLVHLLEPIDVDFAVPQLVVTLRFSEPFEHNAVGQMALDVYHVVTALSDYEKMLGGRGLRLVDKTTSAGSATLGLAPILAADPMERMNKIIGVVSEWSLSRQGPVTSNGSLTEALDRATASAFERLKLAIARRDWIIECKIDQ